MDTRIWQIVAAGAAGVTIACGAFALGAAMTSDSNSGGGAASPAPTGTTAAPGGPGSAAPGVTEAPAAAGGTATAGAPQAVAIARFAFEPAELSVPVGSTIIWTNDDEVPHSVVDADSVLASPDMAQGETYEATLDQPGTVDYYCGIHQYMKATVTVTP